MLSSLKILLSFSLLFLISCSASYERLSNETFTYPNEFSKHLFEAYKIKADFEAIEMHDWNSAKLYSEKALAANEGDRILPQIISYWKIEPAKRFDLIKGYNNLMTIYDVALNVDPYNLAKAISSLDCWSEQQEESWQTWDINKCRDDFINAMHTIYGILDEKNQESSKSELNSNISKSVNSSNDIISIVTQDKKQNILQIIYFDFDKFNLTQMTINEIKNFIDSNKEKIERFIIVGHTDTMGTKEYNIKLSIQRAKAVEDILLGLGIQKENIKILGKGESDLSVKTNDEVEHPANRRAEISPLN